MESIYLNVESVSTHRERSEVSADPCTPSLGSVTKDVKRPGKACDWVPLAGFSPE